MSIGLLVDSSIDLPVDWAAAHDVTIAPMHIVLPQGAFRDDAISREDLFALIEEAGEPPRYNGVPNRELWGLYQSILAKHEGLIFLLMPFGENPIWGQATGAQSRDREGLERIKIFQTGVGIVGLAALAVAMARQAEAGLDLEALDTHLSDRLSEAGGFLVPRDTAALERHFNMAILRSEVGDLASQVPILRTGGSLKGVGAVADLEAGVTAMVERATNQLDGREAVVVVTHAFNPASAQQAAEMVKTEIGPAELLITELGPTAGAYLGRGTVGLGYCPL